jgi:hypothetical protein
MAKFVAKHEEL